MANELTEFQKTIGVGSRVYSGVSADVGTVVGYYPPNQTNLAVVKLDKQSGMDMNEIIQVSMLSEPSSHHHKYKVKVVELHVGYVDIESAIDANDAIKQAKKYIEENDLLVHYERTSEDMQVERLD